MLLSERTGFTTAIDGGGAGGGELSSRQTSFPLKADEISILTANMPTKPTRRGLNPDWTLVNQPQAANGYDNTPDMNDRYSEASSFEGKRSWIDAKPAAAAPLDNQKLGRITDLLAGERQHSKSISCDTLSGQVTEKPDTSAMFMKVSTSGKQKKGALKLFQKNHPRLLSHHSMLFEHESQVRRTKKIIQTFLKTGGEILFGPKAENLRGLFKRILTIVRVSQIFKRSHSIGHEQHRLIRDLSSHRYDMEYYSRVRRITWFKIKGWFWRCLEAILRCGAPKDSIFLPTAWVNVYLAAFQLIFNIFALYYASIFIVFDFRNRLLEIENGVRPVSQIYTFNVFVLIFTTFLDILKSFNTAFYRKGEIITDRREIALNYISGRFIFDALSLVSVIMNRTFLPNMSPLLIYRFQFLFFFKIHLVVSLIRYFSTTFIQKEKYDNLIQLIRLLLILCLTSHVNAIFYHTQAQLQIYFLDSTSTWLNQAQLLDATYWVRYVNSFYCAVGTLVTSIIYNPETTLETAFMSLSLLINCCIFGYLINELGNIMFNIERASKTSKKELRLVNSYLQSKKVNRELQTRIRNYLEYMHREEKQLNLEETKIVINKLSGQLKQELMKEVNSQYIRSFQLLNSTFSQKIQEKSLFLMKDHKYTPGEVIFKEGQEDDASIYLVWEGQVDIFHINERQEDTVVSTIKSGHCFGEISFFTGDVRSASARSSEFTSLIQIKRKEFLQLLKEHSQEDYEIFQEINHTMQHGRDFSQLIQSDTKTGKCFTCGSMKHMARNCSLTHFAPLPVAVVLQSQRTQHVNRSKWLRWSGERWRPVNQENLYRLESAAIKLEETHEKLIEDLCEFFGEISDEEIDISDVPQPQQQLQQQQQQQPQQVLPTPRSGSGQQLPMQQPIVSNIGAFDRSTTYGISVPPISINNNEHTDNQMRHISFQKASIQMPSAHQVTFAPTNEPLGHINRFDSIKDRESNWLSGLRRFETASYNFGGPGLQPPQQSQQQQGLIQPQPSPQKQQQQFTFSTQSASAMKNAAGEKLMKAVLKSTANLARPPPLNLTPKNSPRVSNANSLSYDAPASLSHHSSRISPKNNNQINDNYASQAPVTNPFSNLKKLNAGMKTVQALFRLKTLNGGGLKRKSSVVVDASNFLGIRASNTLNFASRDNQQQQQQLQQQTENLIQEDIMNPHLPHQMLQAMQQERQTFQQELQQIIQKQQHAQAEQSTRFGDPYAELVEIFCGQVSLRIDFMRNFAKYFKKFNIEEIEKTSIGKKSSLNKDFNMRKTNPTYLKKATNIKKFGLLKSRTKKLPYLTNQQSSRSNREDMSVSVMPLE